MTINKILFSFHGRINRAKFWGYSIMAQVIYMILSSILIYLAFTTYVDIFGILPILYIPLLWIFCSLWIKRLHDLDKSAWMLLLIIVPFVNIYLFIICGFFKGTNGANKFGPNPLKKDNNIKEKDDIQEKIEL